MKKTVRFIFLFLGVIILAGCGQSNQQQTEKNQDDVKKQNETVAETPISSSTDANEWKLYKNEKRNFAIKYPGDWQVDEDDATAGPIFRPAKLKKEDIQAENYDKNKDCFFSISFLSSKADGTIPCKNNLGEAAIGANKFTKCNVNGKTWYMILHPKMASVLSFRYVDNSSCKVTFEKSLETLTFN